MRDEIREFWSERAERFDEFPGHEISGERERVAWHALILRHLGPGEGRSALDLASGTGVVSHLLDDLGFRVTGLDWSEPMLERARAKASARGRTIAFRMGDAERLIEPDASYEVAVTRHLVWTLLDPDAAFREWLRVLRPGGTLLVVDGDFVGTGRLERILAPLDATARRLGWRGHEPAGLSEAMQRRHWAILSRVHFSTGARADEVARLLREAGFTNVMVDRRLGAVHRAQAARMPFFKGLARRSQHRYAIRAMKPG